MPSFFFFFPPLPSLSGSSDIRKGIRRMRGKGTNSLQSPMLLELCSPRLGCTPAGRLRTLVPQPSWEGLLGPPGTVTPTLPRLPPPVPGCSNCLHPFPEKLLVWSLDMAWLGPSTRNKQVSTQGEPQADTCRLPPQGSGQHVGQLCVSHCPWPEGLGWLGHTYIHATKGGRGRTWQSPSNKTQFVPARDKAGWHPDDDEAGHKPVG